MIQWPCNKKEIFPKEHNPLNIPDITYSRNVVERIASVPVGNQFAISTREGLKIFKCVGIQKPSNVKVKDK